MWLKVRDLGCYIYFELLDFRKKVGEKKSFLSSIFGEKCGKLFRSRRLSNVD